MKSSPTEETLATQSMHTEPTESSISHAFRPFMMPIAGPARILPSAPQTAPADDSEARSAAVMLRDVSSISAVVAASSDSEASGVTARPMKRQPTVIHIQALRLCSPKRYQRLPLRAGESSTPGGSSELDSPGASGPARGLPLSILSRFRREAEKGNLKKKRGKEKKGGREVRKKISLSKKIRSDIFIAKDAPYYYTNKR